MPCLENRAALVIEAIEAAKAARVGHIVALTIPAVERSPSSMFGMQIAPINRALESCGVPYTLLSLTLFFEDQWFNAGTIKSESVINTPHDCTKQYPAVAAADIGEAAAAVLMNPAAHSGRKYLLMSEMVCENDYATAFTDALGKPVRAVRCTDDKFRTQIRAMGLPDWEITGTIEWLLDMDKGVYNGCTNADLSRLIGRTPMTFKAWAHSMKEGFSDRDENRAAERKIVTGKATLSNLGSPYPTIPASVVVPNTSKAEGLTDKALGRNISLVKGDFVNR